MAEVRVVAPDGTRGSVDENELLSAMDKGFKPEAQADEEARQTQLQADYGDFGGNMLGRTEAFAKGATLGLSGLAGDAASGLAADLATPDVARAAGPGLDAELETTGSDFSRGFEQANIDRLGRNEALGNEAYAWEALGAIAPAVLSGGGTLGARALAATPAAMLERAGAGLASKLGAGAAGSTIAQNVLGRGAAGALEGAVGSALTTAADVAPEVVADPIGAAEAIGMSAATGLLLGGAIGAGAGLVEGGLRAGARAFGSAVDAPTTPALQTPPPVQATADDIVAANAVRPMSAAELPAPQRGKIQELVDRSNALNGDYNKAADDASRTLWREMEAQSRDQEQFDLLTGIAAKRRANEMAAQEALANGPAFREVTEEVVDEVPLTPEELLAAGPGAAPTRQVPRQQVRQVLTETAAARRDASQQMVKGLIDEINGYRAGLPDADAQGLAPLVKSLEVDLEHAYSAFDRGDLAEGYDILDQRVRRRIGEVALNAKAKNVQDFAKKLYNAPQEFLQNEDLFGPLARAQKQANPTWSDRITKSQDSYWRGMFNQGLEKGSDGWGNMRDVRSDAVNGLVRSLGDPGADSLERSVRTNLRSSVADAANRSKAWGSPEAQALADRMAKRAADIENHLDRVALMKRDYLAAQSPDTPLNALRMAVSQVPVVGPAAQAVGGAAARASMGLFARAYRNSGNVIMNAARGVVSKAADAAGSVARYAPMTATVTESKRDEMIKEAQELQSMQSPATQQLLRQAARIEPTDPVLAESMVTSKLAQAEYILGKLPTPPSTSAFSPPARLDPVSKRSMDRTMAAIANPQKALLRMGDGSASPEDIDVMQKLFPATYGRFTQAVAAEMAKLKKPPSLQQRLRLGRITGLNVDASLEKIAQLQAAAQAATPGGDGQQGAQPPQGGGPAPKTDPNEMWGTKADKILAGSQ